ncbi:hypothetical protein [Phormidesmis priestleyi]|uniref:hypothetical protein n=1 Tax=Phormidesmis priestleyi TaxID=268141 RepID=UPI000A94A72B|nr:hypothetical protein [Phormidesmis priestleyi]
MNCPSDCNQGNCPFVNDPQRVTRYVCLRCGLERDINDGIHLDPFLLPLLIASLVVMLIMSQRSPTPQPDQAPTELPSP